MSIGFVLLHWLGTSHLKAFHLQSLRSVHTNSSQKLKDIIPFNSQNNSALWLYTSPCIETSSIEKISGWLIWVPLAKFKIIYEQSLKLPPSVWCIAFILDRGKNVVKSFLKNHNLDPGIKRWYGRPCMHSLIALCCDCLYFCQVSHHSGPDLSRTSGRWGQWIDWLAWTLLEKWAARTATNSSPPGNWWPFFRHPTTWISLRIQVLWQKQRMLHCHVFD